MIEIIRAHTGVPDLDVTLLNRSIWRMSRQVAANFRKRRVFLVGDAAHRFPPTGGFGLNSGVQDAHNLAWKLVYVLRGMASEKLLDSYDVERRPVAQSNADFSYGNMIRFRRHRRCGAFRQRGPHPLLGQRPRQSPAQHRPGARLQLRGGRRHSRRHAARRASHARLHADRPARRALPAHVARHGAQALDARLVRQGLHRGRRSARRRLARGRPRRRRQDRHADPACRSCRTRIPPTASTWVSAAPCWCVPTATSPGACPTFPPIPRANSPARCKRCCTDDRTGRSQRNVDQPSSAAARDRRCCCLHGAEADHSMFDAFARCCRMISPSSPTTSAIPAARESSDTLWLRRTGRRCRRPDRRARLRARPCLRHLVRRRDCAGPGRASSGAGRPPGAVEHLPSRCAVAVDQPGFSADLRNCAAACRHSIGEFAKFFFTRRLPRRSPRSVVDLRRQQTDRRTESAPRRRHTAADLGRSRRDHRADAGAGWRRGPPYSDRAHVVAGARDRQCKDCDHSPCWPCRHTARPRGRRCGRKCLSARGQITTKNHGGGRPWPIEGRISSRCMTVRR